MTDWKWSSSQRPKSGFPRCSTKSVHAATFPSACILRDATAQAIQERFPKIPRLVSGFENLDALLPGRDFNVAKAITGTEGSCAITLEAKIILVPSPKCKAIALLSFDDVYEAADAVPALLEQKPDALEGFDGKLFDAVRATGGKGLEAFPKGRGFLIVEAGGESAGEAKDNVRKIIDRADTGARCRHRLRPQGAEAHLAGARTSLGATAFVKGEQAHWPGWEDSAVPPDRLGSYLRDLERLFPNFNYTAALYGHFGDGVTHCRINFDFRSEEGLREYRKFVREAANLVHSYGGSLSGEHGDGQARAELLKVMYGEEIVDVSNSSRRSGIPATVSIRARPSIHFQIDSNLRLGLTYDPQKR